MFPNSLYTSYYHVQFVYLFQTLYQTNCSTSLTFIQKLHILALNQITLQIMYYFSKILLLKLMFKSFNFDQFLFIKYHCEFFQADYSPYIISTNYQLIFNYRFVFIKFILKLLNISLLSTHKRLSVQFYLAFNFFLVCNDMYLIHPLIYIYLF